jgi:putative zinc finger/helix-turn-helix YgiT family protein
MNCSNCDNPKQLKKTKVTRPYKESGLDNVTLIGVEMYRCDRCGETYFGYGNIEQLHGVISNLLIQKKGLLTGKEVRFLRKHLGYSGAMFAQLIGYERESISRIETGAQPVTEQFDRLVRFSVAAKLPDRNYDLHDQILHAKGVALSQIELTADRKGDWRAKAA